MDFCFADPRAVVVPIEHLAPAGVDAAFAAALRERAGWTASQVDLLNQAFARYWARTASLARSSAAWAPPRLRHIAVVAEPLSVHPFAQLLNTSAWTLYACDLDPARSDAEFVAYLLAHGDRTAISGEVTQAALHTAAWWLERSEAECSAFAAAAARSARPDGAAFAALAAALPWLRQLGYAMLRPVSAGEHRLIPGSGLLVPTSLTAEPPALVERWAVAARAALHAYEARWRAPDLAAVDALLDWLAAQAPPLLVLARGGRVLWDPDVPTRAGALRAELKRTAGAAVRDIQRDLQVVDRQSRRFRAALAAPQALPPVAAELEPRGYVFLHPRRLLAYNLDEPGIDRRGGPALPYARAMLGARAAHEWAHLAVDAGWVPCRDASAQRAAVDHLGALLDATIAAAPSVIRRDTADDLAALVASERAATPGGALAAVLLRRMADFQANLLAQRFLDRLEIETYVRHNLRTLRPEYPPPKRWRMLTRYLYEYQYLRFSQVADPRTFFLRSTWFDADFLATGVLDEARLDALLAAVGAICDCYAVDERRFGSSESVP